MRDNIAAASAKPDEARIWVGKVYADAQTVDVLDDSEGFATLDAKLLASLTNCAEGDLGRQIATFKELRAREEKPVKGRRLSLRFHEYFATSIKHGAIYGLEYLMSVKMVNDDLKGFINKWDSVLAGMKKEPDDNVRSGPKTQQCLLPKKGVCFEFQKTGKCKRCASCPHVLTSTRKAATKGRGKGKERSRSQSRSLTPGSRKETCKFWKAGHCHRVTDCAFQRPRENCPCEERGQEEEKEEGKATQEK